MLKRYPILRERIFFKQPLFADMFKVLFSFKPLVNSRLYKSYTLRKARSYANRYRSEDIDVEIETTLDCNSKCIMCYHSKKKLSGTMTVSLFKKIVDNCLERKVNHVHLVGYGEPLMDRFLFKRLEYLKSLNITYSLFTNAIFMTKDKAEAFFRLGNLKMVNFSVCGYEEDVYRKIMGNPHRNTVYRNILNFLEQKNDNDFSNVEVRISTVKTKFNQHEIKRFVNFWKRQEGVDGIIVADLWDRIGGGDISAVGKVGRMQQKGRWLSPCRQLWGPLSVFFDGRVAPCTADSDLRRLIVGDLKSQNLLEINSSKTLNDLRRVHLEDKRTTHRICGGCHLNYIWIDV